MYTGTKCPLKSIGLQEVKKEVPDDQSRADGAGAFRGSIRCIEMHFHIILISWKDSFPTPSRCFGLQPVQVAAWIQHFEKPGGETQFGER